MLVLTRKIDEKILILLGSRLIATVMVCDADRHQYTLKDSNLQPSAP